MAIKVLLYSADGADREPELGSVDVASLTDRDLLWIDLASPSAEEAALAAQQVGCGSELMAFGPTRHQRPRLVNHGRHFHLTAIAAGLSNPRKKTEAHWMTLIAGPNWVVSVHNGGIDFVDELREREKGETGIGALSAESFVASLLDWLLNTYFKALEIVVGEIDAVEVAVLGKRRVDSTAQLLDPLIQARRRVAELRRLLISHRDVFYGLARPDFMATEKPETRPHFITLNAHLERAEDDMDHSRELVIGAFELLSMRAAQSTNDTMQVLTFVTVLLGSLAFAAGVLGMNFDIPMFHSGTGGFLIAVGAMAAAALISMLVAKRRKWI